jgi:integrase
MKRYVKGLVQAGRVELDGKYVVGRNGWLFLADDSNDSLAQHTGERGLSSAEVAAWTALLGRRVERLGARDCPYLMLVAPDTHSVYPEYLPVGMAHAAERPVHQIMSSVERSASGARVVYPLAEMTAQKEAGLPVCSPIDSHWTDAGAFSAYSALMDELEQVVDARRVTRSDFLFFDMVGGGDLGSKLTPPRLAAQPVALVRYPQARLLYDNCVENTGSLAITECRLAPPTTCLLLGDSYAYSFMKFLSESFGRVVLAHTAALDGRLVEQFEPDVVMSLSAERFLVEVPDDAQASLAAQEREKRRARRTRPPLINWFRVPRWPSPADAEALRAHFVGEGKVRDATIISVLAYGGLLPQEVTALRWPDVGEDELVIRRRGQRVGQGPPARRVPLIGPLADDLREWRRLSDPSRPRSLVFPGRDGHHWAPGAWTDWRSEVFDPAVKACGLDLESPHELRHTFCTLALHEGLPTRELARRIGVRSGEAKRLYGWLAEIIESRESVDPATLVRAARGSLAVAAL